MYLLNMNDLYETAVAVRLTTKWMGQRYRYYETIGSTNDALKNEINGLEEGTVCLTNYQTKGRGRLSRNWQAPPNTALLFSILLRPNWPAEQAQWLTMIAALASAKAINALSGLDVRIKWPNDLMLFHDNAWRKTAGILLESQFNGEGMLESAVLGIGLNVNLTAAQLALITTPSAAAPPTSLLIAGKRPYSRLSLLTAILQAMEMEYELAQYGSSPHPAWNRALITIGQPVAASAGNGKTIVGVAESTDQWGRLLIRTADNQLHAFAAGDVTLRRGASKS